MKFTAGYLLVFYFMLFQGALKAQDTAIDELERKIADTENDTLRLGLCKTITAAYLSNNPEKAKDYAHKQLMLAQKLSQNSMIVSAYLSLSISSRVLMMGDSARYFARMAQAFMPADGYQFSVCINLGNVHNTFFSADSASYYYREALVIAQKENNEKNIASAYNNLGMIYFDLGELQVSYQNYLQALKIFEKIADKRNQAIAMNNIGLVNMEIGNHETAIAYFENAIGINDDLGDNYNLSMNYTNLGVIYKKMGEYETALDYYNKSLAICEKYGFAGDLARHYHNIGNVYLQTNRNKEAQESFLKSLNLSELNGQKNGVLYNNFALGQLEMAEGLYASAERRYAMVDELIDELGLSILKVDMLEQKALLEEKRGNLAKALQYHKQFKTYADSMQDVANQHQIDEMQIKYETEKKSLENDKLKDQNLLNRQIIRNQRLLGIVSLVSFVFLILFTIIILRSRQKLRRAFVMLKKLNKEVILQKEKLEEASATKDKMFSIIAHDLRSPFNSLLGLLNLLISDFETMEDEEKKEMLEVVNNQSIKTYGLLENLLQWSMMQRGMIQAHPVDLDLHTLVHFQFNELSARAGNKQIGLINNVPADLKIYIDETICNTLLRNLINNSIKFTGRGGTIQVEAYDELDKTIIKVIDDGVGMPREQASRLFNKNTHNSSPGTENETGTGLGLRIVKDFVDLLKANIQVESQPGKGTVFLLSFRKKEI